MPHNPSVVIVGGGFAGLSVAIGLKRAAVSVTLADRRNFHLFQPLLYQVATGALSPGDISAPLRAVLRGQANTKVLMATVTDFDLGRRRVVLADGELSYDYLVVAAGAENHYFGNDAWAEHAPALKTIEDATEIRGRIFLAFEQAEREPDAEQRKALLRFVVVGAGPTGVELAGAISEIARDTLRNDFRLIRPEESEILLLEHSPRVLPPFPQDLSDKAERALIRLGVRSRTGVLVTGIDRNGVDIRTPDGQQRIESRTVIWAAGVRPSPLAEILLSRTGAQADRTSRIVVSPDLTIPGHEEIFVIGDMAHFTQNQKPLPAVAPVAMQQGRFVAKAIRDRIEGRQVQPFRYRDKGNMATIGRNAAVAHLGPLRFNGALAWLAWLFIHLLYLVGFRNRLLVAVQWGFQYLTYNRGARLITGKPGVSG